MGSCYKDCRLEGESVSLGDGDGDQSLEAESEENEAKQVDLGREGFGEEIGSLNNIYCGVDIRGDCVELVIGVKKAETQSLSIMGDEEENDHLGPEKATDVCVWKKDIEGFEGYGDRNLQVEAEDNEPKQENLEKEDAMRESRHLELGKVLVEEVGGSTNINGGAEVANDCGELVEKESGHLGLDHAVDISEFKKDFKGCKAEAHPISDVVNVLNDINGGAHCSDNESEHRILVHNAEEGREISRVVKENVHLRLEQPVKVSILWTDFNQCEMHPSSANVDAFDRNNAASVDGGSDIKGLIFEKKDDINSSGYTGAEKDSELIGLAQMLEVKAPEPVSVESDCLRCCSFENVDESKKSNTCYSVHTLEVEVTNNLVSVDGGSGSGELAGGKKEAEDVCWWDSGSNEDIGHLDVEKESAFEAPKSVSEKEHDEFPGLSPLRTLSGGDFACSIFSMESEVGLLSSGMFDSDGGRNGCEDAEILVSSALAAGCPLLRIDGDASKKSDGQCCPHDASQNVEANCTFERSEKLCSFGDEKVNCSQLSEGDNRGRNDSKSNPIIVFRRSNPKRSASLRSNLADGKHNPSSTGSNRRNCGKAVHISPTFLLSTIKISGKVKRKRSCSHRIARPSLWGPVEDLIKIFEQNVRLANHDGDRIPDRNKRSKKVRPTVCRKRHAKSQRDGKFRVSAANHSATPDKVEVKHKWAGDNFALAVKSLRNRQLGDKDVESSLTQEVSVELGELPGVSSQIAPEMLVKTASDRNSSDPGTSPDSDVYHPVIDANTTTSEFTNSAGQDIRTKDVIITSDDVSTTSGIQSSGMVQNMHVLGAASEVGLHSVVSPSTGTSATSFFPPPDPNLCDKAKKGKKSGHLSKQTVGEKLHGPDNTKKLSNCSKSKERKQDVINKKNRGCLKSIKKTFRKGSEDNSFPPRSYVYKTNDLECLDESVKVQDSLEKCVLPDQDFINPDNGHKFSNGTNPRTSKGRSHCRETTGQKRRNAHGKKGKCVQNSDNRCSTEERSRTVDVFLDASDCMSFSSGALNSTLMVSTQQNWKTNADNTAVLEDVSSLVMTSAGDLIPNESTTSLEKPLPPQVAWVLCDDCEKWRCISVELANTLEETKCKWTCKDNADKAFSDCSIPQEKTNAEINAELGIIDEEDPSSVEANTNGVKPSKLAAAQRTSWTPIKSNVFLHRSRKTQTIDEIMVCHCKPPRDGHWGCGDQCLNRMLNIECAKGTCPCGDLCSNQQFQKRKYAKFEWLRCGKKGYGLQLLEDASQGQFLIEYVGEVLDLATYDARQREYAFQGQKHFYFMTLNGGEVIDACAKGNLGRFINHSCEPNCRTEKWMVNGEVCIGLFAIRDIKKGEEVTFDYNYVRVVGAAAKKCICGSSGCRGYLGGDPLNSEIIVQSDTDEEDIEPVITHEKGQRELTLNDSVSHANDVMISKYKENSGEMKDNAIRYLPAIPEPEVCVQNKDGVCRDRPEVNPLDTCLQSLYPMQAEETISRPDAQPLGVLEQSLNSAPVKDNICKLTSDIQPEDISLRVSTTMNEGLSDSVLNNKKAVTDVYEEKPSMAKPHSFTKSSHSRGTIKRGRSSVKNIVFPKPKTFASGAGSSHSEGVEEKLNELLEIDGGISKKNDATRGYLKLLFVTAAEGDVGGCASQSTRDLSLILDAILKTKSRKVLVDIINKNGLQMLHNIMKQNRGNFNRIPILRKLLKVLEFLAFTGILTPELINKDPPHSGMESFKVSILKLASHSDKQVHKIAREFRDKWIPRNIRRVEPSDRDSVQLDQQLPHHICWTQSSKVTCQQVQAARDNDAIIIINAADHRPASSSGLDNPGGTFSSYNSHHQQSISRPSVSNINSSASGTKPRKRKSRWDHPSDTTTADPQDQIFEQAGPKFPKYTPDLHNIEDGNSSQDLMQLDGDDGRPPGFFNDDNDDDGPPGFQNNLHSQSSPSAETTSVTGELFVMGHPQEIYLSHVTMSYGIPVVLMQQLGTSEAGENHHQFCNQNWAIAPGMPFHPFPPLPSYPRKAGQKLDTDLRLSEGGMTETGNGSRNSVFNGRRLRFPSNRGCGTRFLRPQRWDNSNNNRRKFQSCWSRGPIQRFSRGGFGGNSNIRNGVRNIRGDFRGGLCPPDGVNNNDASSVFRQLHN